MLPLSRSQLTQEGDQDLSFSALFAGTVNSSGQVFSFWSEHQGQREIIKRFLGHILISQMPPEGIDEALVSLREILEYHRGNAFYKLSEPEIIRRGTGKVTEASERPDLVISE